MRLKSILVAAALGCGLSATAQSPWVKDSVNMGAGFTKDVYYSLDKPQSSQTANTWNIGFQMLPQSGQGSHVAIIVNHANGDSLWSLHYSASGVLGKYESLSASDTAGRTRASQALFNRDSSWYEGAFNLNNNPANIFDFSWGKYDLQTHNITGDSVYLLRSGGQAYKVWIQKFISTPLDSARWEFRIAPMGTTGDAAVKFFVRMPLNLANRQFGYYNVATRAQTDREPARQNWDMLFTRYAEQANGNAITTGVLSNLNNRVARVQPLDPNNRDTAGRTFLERSNRIGADWKRANNSIVDSISYFVTDTGATKMYQMQFLRYDGPSTGKVVFRKRDLRRASGGTSVNEASGGVAVKMSLYPNPAQDEAHIVVDTRGAVDELALTLTDLTGRVVRRYTVRAEAGLNTYAINTSALPAGLYLVNAAGDRVQLSGRLLIQR